MRAAAIALASGLSGALFYAHMAGQIAGQSPWLVAGLVYAILIGFTAAATFRFVPKFGPFLYYTAATRLALACVAALVPDVAHRLTTSPFLNATLIVGGAFVLQAMLRARPAAPATVTLSYAPATHRAARATAHTVHAVHARP